MNIDKYDIFTDSLVDYYFFSEGPNGKIKKQVCFRKSGLENYYQLSFGDVIKGNIQEDVVSDNKDTDKVLATIMWIIIKFLQQSSFFHIRFTGLTKARNRLFNKWIEQNYNEITQYIYIYGYKRDKWEKFYPNRYYEAFLIKIKNYDTRNINKKIYFKSLLHPAKRY
ncbi:MAG: hypothetical protein LBH91_01790 [Prevotellaceae bacterium]|jgi:hypothetical protein|nr:hypothetical protein [Prevotellaceae bacterium]